MANPSEAQAPQTADAGRIYVELKEAPWPVIVRWMDGPEGAVGALRGEWEIDLPAFDLLAKHINQKWPSADVGERLMRADDNVAAAERRLAAERATWTERHAADEAATTATEAAYLRIIDKLLDRLPEGERDRY